MLLNDFAKLATVSITFKDLSVFSRKPLNSKKTLHVVVETRTDPKIMGLWKNGKYFSIIFSDALLMHFLVSKPSKIH